MSPIELAKKAVSTISGLLHYYRPRRVPIAPDSPGLETAVMIPAAFGSFGDQALALGTQELSLRDNVSVRFLVPGDAESWRGIGLQSVESIDGYIDARLGLVSARGKEILHNRNLIVIGADTVDGAYGEAFTAVRLAALNDAASSGRVARLVNFSFSHDASRTSKRFMRGLHPKVEVWARDALSASRAKNVLGREVLVAPDIGAMMQPKSSSIASLFTSNERPILVLVPSGHTGKSSRLDRRKLRDYWVDIGKKFSEEFKVLVMPHDVRSFPDDPVLCREISERVSGSVFLQPSDSPEAKSVISMSDALVSGRMHACVASLSTGIPTIGLGYQGKFEGQFAWYGSGGKVHTYDDPYELLQATLKLLEPSLPSGLFEKTTWLQPPQENVG